MVELLEVFFRKSYRTEKSQNFRKKILNTVVSSSNNVFFKKNKFNNIL